MGHRRELTELVTAAVRHDHVFEWRDKEVGVTIGQADTFSVLAGFIS
jgi:hypothetical protein